MTGTAAVGHRTLVDAQTLADALRHADWLVVDCRFDLADTGRGERHYRTGHIPGAVYAHLDRDLSGPLTHGSGRHPLPDPQRLAAWFGELGIGPETQVVAYDDAAGAMAVRLWWLLRWLGHDRVAVLDGGWAAWLDAGHPIDAGPPAPRRPLPFAVRPALAQVVTTARLREQVARGAEDILLIDVRSPERFRGEQEPIDPVAGHVPGARNLPLTRNVDSDGRFRTPTELDALYRGVIGSRPPGEVAVMCGSGVTACHALLAMELAGLSGACLYAGSWSEWIQDPDAPIATGG
jgi:thiosulfate/3-mercaptopyruvate sulfurtransferase